MVGVTDILVFLLFVKFADQYLPQNNFLLKQPIALKLDINNMVGVTDIFGIIGSRSYVICYHHLLSGYSKQERWTRSCDVICHTIGKDGLLGLCLARKRSIYPISNQI